MSDPSTAAPADEQYVSQIDPAFAAAWNDVYNPETPETAGPSTEAPPVPPAGAPAPAAPVQGDRGEPRPEPAPPAGVGPDAGGTAPADPASPVVDSGPTGTGHDYAVIAPKFGEASNAIQE